MDVVDLYIDYAAEKGVKLTGIMMAPSAIEDFQNNGLDCSTGSYRGLPIEEHDEWSWGWMLKTEAGTFEVPIEETVELHRRHGLVR